MAMSCPNALQHWNLDTRHALRLTVTTSYGHVPRPFVTELPVKLLDRHRSNQRSDCVLVKDTASTVMADVKAVADPLSAEQAAFVAEDVTSIIKESIDAVLQNQPYSHLKVGQWTSTCLETCIKRLADLNKPFKYVVTTVIMQKNGAGLHTAASCFWDNASDGSRTVKWENKTMYCITTVFGLSL